MKCEKQEWTVVVISGCHTWRILTNWMLMARMVTRPGNHLREERLEWKPKVEKICLDMVAVAKYPKVYTYKRGDAAAKSLSHVRLCVILWNCSPPGSFVHGVLQARTLEWVAMTLSRRSSWPRDWTRVSCIAGWFFTIWATRVEVIDRLCLFLWHSLWQIKTKEWKIDFSSISGGIF